MARWMVALFAVLALTITGCGKKAIGPADEDAVKKADDQQVKNQMEESAKYLPPGVKMPSGPATDSN